MREVLFRGKEFDTSVFAKRLKEARAKVGMPQRELARLANVSVATVSKYEQINSSASQISPTIGAVYAFATILNVSVDWLCGLTDTPTLQEKSIDTETFLFSIIELIRQAGKKKTGIYIDKLEEDTDVLTLKRTSYPLCNFIYDYLKVENVIDANLMPADLNKSLLQDVIDKYKGKPIDELCENPELLEVKEI